MVNAIWGSCWRKQAKWLPWSNPDGTKLWESEGSIGEFHEGLALVTSPDGKQEGFIDTRGQWAIPMRPCETRHFENGFAPYRPLPGDKWGFIDHRGNVVVRPEWDEVKNFREGLAAVRRGDKWGFVDGSGKVIAEPTWEKVADFSEGLAGVFLGTKKANERRVGDRRFDSTWSGGGHSSTRQGSSFSATDLGTPPGMFLAFKTVTSQQSPVATGDRTRRLLLIDRLGRETPSPWGHTRPPGPLAWSCRFDRSNRGIREEAVTEVASWISAPQEVRHCGEA